ncbi:MAG: electron transfer flavoprotein subunit alpha/FixB family protein [Planctomycetota bacterium]
MRKVLIVAERSASGLDDSALELVAAARSLGDLRVAAVILGRSVSPQADELARWCDEVFVFDHASLETFDGEFYSRVLVPLCERLRPSVTLVAHSNLGMDLGPALAMRTGMPQVADCLRLEAVDERLTAVRAMYGGKVHARVSAPIGASGVLVTMRPGAYSAPEAAPGVGGAVSQESIPLNCAPRRRLIETVAPEPGAVDISQAEILVSVGRGIEEEENIEIARSLAAALGGELACTRPVVDKKWLSKSHQVGTSGTTVKPKIYLAIGVSGSFQHLGGIKGNPFIAAINKDAAAPIFAVADVGIVGDLFDIVPLLEEKILERKG